MGNVQAISAKSRPKRYIEIISAVDAEPPASELFRSKFQSSSKRLTKLFMKQSSFPEKQPEEKNGSEFQDKLLIQLGLNDTESLAVGKHAVPKSAGELIVERHLKRDNRQVCPVDSRAFLIKPIGYENALLEAAKRDQENRGPENASYNHVNCTVSVENLMNSATKHAAKVSFVGADVHGKENSGDRRKKSVSKRFKGGATYTGDWDPDQKRHGYGVFVWPDGARYEGEWAFNKAMGRGRYENAEGEVYDGEWLDDKANGIGTFTSKYGSVYTGNWKDDLQHGHGCEIWPDGLKYEGDFFEGEKHGFGCQTFIDGSVYEGAFKNSLIEGPGKYITPGGKLYEGEWKNNKMEGFGTIKYSTGKVFRGTFREGRRDGPGESICATGEIWKGIWIDGRRSSEDYGEMKQTGSHGSASLPSDAVPVADDQKSSQPTVKSSEEEFTPSEPIAI